MKRNQYIPGLTVATAESVVSVPLVINDHPPVCAVANEGCRREMSRFAPAANSESPDISAALAPFLGLLEHFSQSWSASVHGIFPDYPTSQAKGWNIPLYDYIFSGVALAICASVKGIDATILPDWSYWKKYT